MKKKMCEKVLSGAAYSGSELFAKVSLLNGKEYSETSVAQTGLGPRKFVPVKGSSSQPG